MAYGFHVHPKEYTADVRGFSFVIERDGDLYKAYKSGKGLTFEDDDASEVIQSCINALPNRGGRIFLKSATYEISEIITLKSNVEIVGEEQTLLQYTSERCFWGKDVSNINIENIRIHHVNPEDYSGGTSNGILIEAISSINRNIKIRNCEISNCLRAGIHINIGLTESASGTYGFRDILIENNYVHDLITGDAGTDGNGITLGRGYMEKVRIRNNRIENMLSTGILVGSEVGFGLFKDVKIEKNYIKDVRYYAIDLSGLYDSEIVENYIYNSDDIISSKTYGIFIETADIQPSERVKIKDNVIDGAGLVGINIYSNINRCEIIGNTTRRIKNPTGGGARHILAVGTHHRVVGNLIDGSEDGSDVDGMSIGNYGFIAFNRFFSTTRNAIEEVDKTGLIIAENYIENPSRSGIDLADVTNSIVKGNYVKGVPSGYYGIYERGTSDYNIIALNNLLECDAGRRISYVGANTVVRRNLGYLTENSGVATFSGDGSTTEFKIEHGLVSTPSKYVVTPLTPDAHADKTITVDSTYIIITFSTAPPSGTDNLKFGWWAEV